MGVLFLIFSWELFVYADVPIIGTKQRGLDRKKIVNIVYVLDFQCSLTIWICEFATYDQKTSMFPIALILIVIATIVQVVSCYFIAYNIL